MSVATATTVPMPRLSDSMEEGTIVRWLKRDGEAVSAGEPIVEIETDKATVEYEAEADGILEIVAADGATVALGEPIARIAVGSAGRVPATPVARRLAASLGIELASVRGTGRRGHVVKADIEAIAAAGGGRDDGHPAAEHLEPPEPPSAPPPPVTPRGITRHELTPVQRRIATRMSESRALVPDFTLEVEIEMSACLALRAQLAEHADPRPSINDMIVKACGLALRGHPRANGSYRDGGFDLHDQVNVGIAVAAPDALLVPVIRDADRAHLVEIAKTSRALAARVRSGQITPPELAGATFTVSNLGMYGITRFTAVINPPQAAILAVGSVEPRAVVRDGELSVAPMMTATVASDHRILYGADAAAFLRDVRERLQAPMSLLV